MTTFVDKEYKWFTNNRKKLYEKYGDVYVAIKNNKVIGQFKSFAEGVTKTQRKEKIGTFIVQRLSLDGNADNVYTYLVDIILPNNMKIKQVKMCSSKIGAQNLDLLIGTDIINKGDFAISNYKKNTCFTFRIPSKECIDFSK